MSDNRFLTGKTALVTCSSRGIGYAVAEALAKAGAKLTICSRDRELGTLLKAKESLEILAQTPVSAIRCDLTEPEGCVRLLEGIEQTKGHGDVDIFVCSSPHPASPNGLQGITYKALSNAVNGCVSSPLMLCQSFAPQMAAAGWGRIILLSSCYAARPTSRFYLSSYLRPSISNLARLIAEEYAHEGVVANALLLGYYATSLTAQFSQADENIAQALRLAPGGQLPSPNLLGDFIVSMCSEKGFLINGSDILLDYGYLCSSSGRSLEHSSM
jgi:NAD(P)-dependent dehydrogenase (short-subunit alcohol dehydrogenase family)